MNKKHREQNRLKNTLAISGYSATQMLSLVSKNNGYHLIIDTRFDYWPSTDKWVERVNQFMPITGPRKGRGVKELIRAIEDNTKMKHICTCNICGKEFK
jgi:hypothetical protein